MGAYLLDTASGWVLLDAGMNPDNGRRDRARMEGKFWSQGMTALRGSGDGHLSGGAARVAIGVGLEDINQVILSHLHYDHAGCLRRFGHAQISVQRGEYEHAFGG